MKVHTPTLEPCQLQFGITKAQTPKGKSTTNPAPRHSALRDSETRRLKSTLTRKAAARGATMKVHTPTTMAAFSPVSCRLASPKPNSPKPNQMGVPTAPGAGGVKGRIRSSCQLELPEWVHSTGP
jgi:hypothetical protein